MSAGWWRGTRRLDPRTRDMMPALTKLTPDLPYIRLEHGSYRDGENSADAHSRGEPACGDRYRDATR